MLASLLTPVDTARLLAFVADASRAPSVLNTQPWRFRLTEGVVDLFADRDRQLPALDPAGRELTLSCGAALAGLRTAASHDGLDARFELFPDASDPDWLARVVFEPAPRPLDDRRLRALRSRRTHRGDFADEPVAPTALATLARAAGPDVWLAVVTTADEKEPIADLVEEATRALGQHPTRLIDVRAWLRVDGDPRPDGVRDRDQGEGDRLATVRTTSAAVGRHKADILRQAPAVLVLGTADDAPETWLRAGIALGDLLIAAADLGLAVSYANEPVEMGGAFRRRLGALVGGAWPQLVLRLGRPADDPAGRRRPLRDIAEVA
ncbi:Acg family FMN-binding oxidoreductase [Rubrivirga sp. IMCC45206]|uniref:Acg family FMN-binding oxidoreductase n=1 Tax=Rubrivirga sp. IMCC45206 TaxID=3391614 RepID=UPI0039902EBE